MGKFKSTTLRNKIHVKHGFSFKGEYFASEGEYIILTPGNFYESGGFKFDIEKAKFYNGEFPEEYICSKGDLVVAMTEQAEGLLGSSAIVPENNRFLHNQRIGLVTVDETEIDKNFLYHVFNTKSVRQQLRSSSSGSKVKHTSPDRIYDVIVNLPPLPIQQKIAAVLSALDAKIELNQRINAELESMAKTLYDYWFVQFATPSAFGTSPKWDMEALQDSQNSPVPFGGGRVGVGGLVWNEALKRDVPAGWEVKPLGDVLKIVRGASPRPIDDFLSAEGMPWVKISDATASDNRFITQTRQFIIEEGISKSRLLQPNTLILSNSASPAIPRITKIECCVHDGWLIIDDYTHGLTKEFMYHYFEYERPRIINLGSGSIFKNLKTEYIKGLNILLPPVSILEEVNPVLQTISENIYAKTKESQTLTKLRDWLLPMLMNGQVTVS